MDPHRISECILRSIEARRRRRQDRPAGGEPQEAPRIGQPVVSACAAELDSAIRDAILTSFHEWEVNLLPQVQGITQRRPPAPPPSEEVLSASPALGPAPPPLLEVEAAGGEGALPGEPAPAREASRIAPLEDSWGSLAEAVRDLRKEWAEETFEARFGREGEGPPAGRPAAPRTESPVPLPPPPAAPPRASAEAAPARASAAPAPPAREPLAEKLDELIRLVRSSLDERGSRGPSSISSAISREVAREVAGRLRETLKGLGPSPAAPAPPARPPASPPAPARIPLDDLGSIIDQITGSSPP